MSRQIVLDTETTGLEIKDGHRMIEIGCVEMQNRRLTGSTLHYYLQPDRAVDPGAYEVHGISNQDLEGKPRFPEIMDELFAYLDGAELIIHNAPFDVGYIEHEYRLAERPVTLSDNCVVTDTLRMARQQFPGQRNNLDALCKRLGVSNGHRTLHGALLDSEILAPRQGRRWQRLAQARRPRLRLARSGRLMATWLTWAATATRTDEPRL